MNFWNQIDRPILALAPMAGITDSSFRLICKQFGADVVYTEMISVDGLVYNSKKTLELLKFRPEEKPIVVQLFGKKPENFYQAVKIIKSSFDFDGVDINLGCPAKKVFGHGSGAALMDNKELGREITKASVEAAGETPVSIKIRAGVKGTSALEFLDLIQDIPIAAVMVHGRTYEQGFSGPIDLEVCKKIVELADVPVLINGGVQKPENAKEILEYTNAAGLGIARSALGQPWIFRQIKECIRDNSYKEMSLEEIKNIAIGHSQLMLESKSNKGLFEMRKHLAWYVKGFENAGKIRSQLVVSESLEQIQEILTSYPQKVKKKRIARRPVI